MGDTKNDFTDPLDAFASAMAASTTSAASVVGVGNVAHNVAAEADGSSYRYPDNMPDLVPSQTEPLNQPLVKKFLASILYNKVLLHMQTQALANCFLVLKPQKFHFYTKNPFNEMPGFELATV